MGDRTKREASKVHWTSSSSPETLDDINCGSLQRIADAAELMAKNHADLIKERDMYKRWYDEASERAGKLQRRNYSLRGHMTRLKRKLKA